MTEVQAEGGWAGDARRLMSQLSSVLQGAGRTDVPLAHVALPQGWQERWETLVATFSLAPLDEDVLLLLVLRVLDPRVGLGLQLLSPQASPAGPPLDVLARCLPHEPTWRLAASVGVDGDLVREALVVEGASGWLEPDARLLAHLLGDSRPSLRLGAALVQRLQADPRAAVEEAQDRLTGGTSVHLHQVHGAWAPPVAATALAMLGWRCLVVDLTRVDAVEQVHVLHDALLEAALRRLALVVGPWDVVAEAAATSRVSRARCPVVTYGCSPWPVRGTSRSAVDVRVAPLSPQERVEVVAGLLAEAGLPEPAAEELAGSDGWAEVALEPDELQHVVDGLVAPGAPLLPDALRGAVGRFRQRALPPGTRVAAPGVRLEDVVASPTVAEGLQAVVDQARHAHTVLDDWGLGHLSRGRRGTTALLCGPPGTGKTLSATAIADALSRPLYVVDVGAVVDKYVGETEKRLEQVFAAVEQAQAVLLFDEADALFGKRAGVSDARDRYANLEVSYLLQRLEEFDGVLLLTTNMRNNLDEAFLRRLDHVVTFDVPEAEERAALWRRHLVAELPGAADVDVARLAQAAVSGGEIRNALLFAASRCAAQGTDLDTETLHAAVERELRKQGRLVALR